MPPISHNIPAIVRLQHLTLKFDLNRKSSAWMKNTKESTDLGEAEAEQYLTMFNIICILVKSSLKNAVLYGCCTESYTRDWVPVTALGWDWMYERG